MGKVQDNKGFSLVELLVVITIMVILSVGMIYGFQNSNGQRAQAGAQLVETYMDRAKSKNFTKNAIYLTISCDNTGRYYVADSDGNRENLPKNVTVTYDTNAGSDNAITAASPLRFSYSRTDGSITPIISQVSNGTFIFAKKDPSSSENKYCTYIHVKAGERQRNIRLYTKTGKYAEE